MRIIKRFSKTNIGQKLIGFLFYSITSLISRSIKWEYLVENEKSNIFRSDKKYIFCCWHNRLFLGPHLLPRNRIINALQSSHSDGMVTSVAFKYLGMNVILGSSKKGGMQAFRKMVKCIQLGESIAITPDGPKGPEKIPKPGIIRAAQKTGAIIIPVASCSTKNWQFINWHTFFLEKPFGKIFLEYGAPISFTKDDDFESCKKVLIDSMNTIEQTNRNYAQQKSSCA